VVYDEEESFLEEIKIAVEIGKEPDQLLSSCFSLLDFKFQHHCFCGAKLFPQTS